MQKSVLYTNDELRRLITPMFFSTLLFMSVGAVDSMMVASLGAGSVSGVALVDMVNVLFGSVLFALGTGGAVVASQYIGAGRGKDANDSAKQLLFISVIFSFLLMFFCIFCSRWALRVFFGKVPEEVETEALKYFHVTAYMYPFLGVSTAAAAILRSIDRAKATLVSSVIINIVNVVGNYLCIFVFKWGVVGAAASTVFSRIIGAVYLYVVLTDRSNRIYVTMRDKYRLCWSKIRKILFIGIPSGFENGIFSIGRLLVVGVVAKFGTEELAANSVANSISSIGCIMGSAFNLAIIPVVGRAVGTGDMSTVRHYAWKMSKWAWVSYAVWNAALLVVLPFILGCYSKLTPDTRSLAFQLCLIHCGFGIFMWTFSFTFPGVLRAANDVTYTMIVSIGSMVFVRIGLAYYMGLSLGMGALGTWIAMVCDWIVRIAFFVWRYRSGAWERHALAALK